MKRAWTRLSCIFLLLTVLALGGASEATAQGALCTGTKGCFVVSLVSDVTNTNGTRTLTWTVTTNCDKALSHVAFELPFGVPAVSPANGSTYTGTHANYYIENTTNNPFYSIKFETIGEGPKNGGVETFVYTLPAGTTLPDPIRIRPKAGLHEQTISLDPDNCTGPSCPAGLALDGLSKGTFVDGENLFPGITVSVSAGNTGGNPRRAMIFDSGNPTGNDPDLGTPNEDFGGPGIGNGGEAGEPGENAFPQGKVLIISDDNNQGNPNDYAGGGTITFTFEGLVDVESIALLDIENGGTLITAKAANGSTIKSVSPSGLGDNSYQLVEIDAEDVKTLEVRFNDSGAIADLFFCSIDLECAANAAPLLDFENLTDPGENPEVDDIIKFTAPFTNTASASYDASNVEVTVTYPTSQFTYVDGSAAGGSSQDASTPGEIVFTINSLNAGDTVTLTFELRVDGGATEGTVTASVTGADEPDLDSTPDNFDVAPGEDDECATPFQNLPVELVSFEAQADGRSATLAWRTASETNNAGFELQHRYLGEAGKASSASFTALAFIEGHGTTEAAQDYTFRLEELEPGHHVFRLKQLDYDGTFAYSPEIEVAIDLPEAYLVSEVYPNPFNPQASFSFSVSRSQEVSVALYNMLGQRVALLFEGVVSEGTSRTLQIDGSALQSGTYLVRVQGESFVNTQTVTLVK